MLSTNTLLQDRYLIVREIGRGGMGAVYEAQHLKLKSTVAVKETLAPDEMSRRALENEAQLLANLRHPALPKVIDHFTEGDSQFMVMEFIPGKDLMQLLHERGEAIPCAQVVDWGFQLLDALEYLHAYEPPVIHRDIKPNNMKLTARGELILLDFGLSKGSTFTSSITSGKSIFGYSLNYAPPEQVQGQGTDPRSDLYSVGATLYHLLTNTPPPDAVSRAVNMAGGQADVLRWANEVNPNVPREIAAVLQSAMAINRDQRPVSAAVMRAVLQSALGLPAGQTTRSKPLTYPVTPTSGINTGEPPRITRSYATIPEAAPPPSESTGKWDTSGSQNFPRENQTSPGNTGSQRVEAVVPSAPVVTAGREERTMPVGEMYGNSESKNALFSSAENRHTEKASSRLWLIIGAVVVVVLAAASVIYFLTMNNGKSASTSAVTNTTTSPATNSNTATTDVAQNANPSPAPAVASSTPAETTLKKGKEEKPAAPGGKEEKVEPAKSEPPPPAPKEEKVEPAKPEPPPPAPKEEKVEPAKPEPAPQSKPTIISAGVITGKATRRVEPAYPPLARSSRISGTVVVEVTVDERGNVIAARAISGHPLLRNAAENAAHGWKFTPAQMSGQPVKVTGTITFNFQM